MIRHPGLAESVYKAYTRRHALRKSVTTWTALATAFNTVPGKKFNVSFSKSSGLFGVPELEDPVGFPILRNRAFVRTKELVDETASPDRKRKMVDIFDELSDTLCQVADLAEFIKVCHQKNGYKRAAENASMQVSAVVERLNTNKELYDNLRKAVEDGDIVPTTEEDQHVAKLFLFDFEQSGIHLPEDVRKKVVELNELILNLSQDFLQVSTASRELPVDVVPKHLRSHFFIDNKVVYITGLFSDSSVEEAREAAYKFYLYPDAEQEARLQALLFKRHELATSCGFPTYAHRAIKGTTAETPEFVETFLNTLSDGIKPKVNEDIDVMQKLKAKDCGNSTVLRPWDLGYYTNVYKKTNLMINPHESNTFFPLGACMEGINILTQSLFGISLVTQEMEPKESWADKVHKLAVVHEKEGLLGHIYCDFYYRTGKPHQDCHFTIRGGRCLENGDYQNPIVVLVLCLPVPKWGSPCLLSPSHLDNLVHEMGHALHSMLARTRHQHVTGTRCCTDFAEIPSILMEYFMSDPRVLKKFARNFQTQEEMTDDAIQKLCESKSCLTAIETQTQILYSVLDQKLHGDQSMESTPTEFYYELQEQYSSLEPIKDIAWPSRFSHLVGYGAKYYSYLLSRSVASHIWQTYFKDDPFSRSSGEKYRAEMLSHGGGKPPRQILKEYLDQDVTPENMAHSLIDEINRK